MSTKTITLPETKTRPEEQTRRQPPYNVILLNDDDHTYEYVITMLQTLFGYPALVDHGDHCDVEVFDDPQEAARIHHAGLRRLFALQLREQVKCIEKNIPNLQQMAMQYMTLGTQEELRNQIVMMALERA